MRTASRQTSGPIPSPGRRVIRIRTPVLCKLAVGKEPLLTLIGRTPAPNQMLCGAFPLRELKLETSFDKTTGDNAAALEHQFRFGAQKKGSYLQHPACSRQPDA